MITYKKLCVCACVCVCVCYSVFVCVCVVVCTILHLVLCNDLGSDLDCHSSPNSFPEIFTAQNAKN